MHAAQALASSEHTVALATAQPDSIYALTLAVKDLTLLRGTDAVLVKVKDAQGEIVSSGCTPPIWIST